MKIKKLYSQIITTVSSYITGLPYTTSAIYWFINYNILYVIRKYNLTIYFHRFSHVI